MNLGQAKFFLKYIQKAVTFLKNQYTGLHKNLEFLLFQMMQVRKMKKQTKF